MIALRHVFKIFGPRPRAVLARLGAPDGESAAPLARGHVVALRDVDLSVARGETFVVMGLSGSGKSTLIRLLNRLVVPTAGEVVVDGVDIVGLGGAALRAFRRRRVSMVFQGFALLPHRTVAENVAYGLEVRGMARARRRAVADDWIARVGLTGRADAYPATLSGGMRQRVGLARALATDPDILLMDEPFGALDPMIRHDMQDQLMALRKTLGKTIVFITHDLDEALRLGDRVAILNRGAVAQIGTPRDILLDPADAYVAAFVKTVNRGRALTAAAVMVPPAGDLGRAPRVAPDTVLEDVLPLALQSGDPVAVVDDRGVVLGRLTRAALIAALAPPPAP